MVGDETSTNSGSPKDDLYSALVGTTQEVTIVSCTKGALVVSLKIEDLIFKGALLETSDGFRPSIFHIPKAEEDGCNNDDMEKYTAYVSEEDDSTAGFTCQYRTTYQLGENRKCYDDVIPSRSILRLHEARKLRTRLPKSKFYLCSMCRTHCFDSENSDSAAPVNATETPSLKISYKSPDGQNIMNIVPKKVMKHYKRKHRDKHKKRSKHQHTESEWRKSQESHNTCDISLEKDFDRGDVRSPPSGLIIDNPSSLNDRSVEERPLQHRKRAQTAAQSRQDKKSRLKKRAAGADSANILSERVSRAVSTYLSPNGQHIGIGDVVWGKITGFPWWPGRVCAINTDETKEGTILKHVADIDWYNSPTKSHLHCSQLHPFLEHFEKKFDKKKKSLTYRNAIEEARRDAILNAQYMQSIIDEDNHSQGHPSDSALASNASTPVAASETSHQTAVSVNNNSVEPTNYAAIAQDDFGSSHIIPPSKPTHQSAAVTAHHHSADIQHTNDELHQVHSPSMLIDAFLRTSDPQLDTIAEREATGTDIDRAAADSSQTDDLLHCLTISLPSPQTLLETP